MSSNLPFKLSLKLLSVGTVTDKLPLASTVNPVLTITPPSVEVVAGSNSLPTTSQVVPLYCFKTLS